MFWHLSVASRFFTVTEDACSSTLFISLWGLSRVASFWGSKPLSIPSPPHFWQFNPEVEYLDFFALHEIGRSVALLIPTCSAVYTFYYTSGTGTIEKKNCPKRERDRESKGRRESWESALSGIVWLLLEKNGLWPENDDRALVWVS